MADIRQQWQRIPLLSKTAMAAFVVLVLLAVAVGAIFFPDGGRGFAYALMPAGLAMAVMGGLSLVNYRGTANAVFDLQRGLSRRLPLLGPRPIRLFNKVVTALMVILGLAIVIAGPFLS